MPIFYAQTPLFVNVKNYGATGNGASNDRAAVQAAIDAVVAGGGGTVFFPRGTYLVDASLIVDHTNIRLLGETGQNGLSTIGIYSNNDPAYAVVIGNTMNADGCTVEGICLTGQANNSYQGGGLLLRGNSCSVIDSYVSQFGGSGIYVQSFSGTIFEIYMSDVHFYENGRYTTTPGDNLVIGSNVSDCEYIRILSASAATRDHTRHGINCSGGNNKFINCHSYFMNGAGFYHSGGADPQIIGGEYESCIYGINLQSGSTRFTIDGVSCFANTDSDVLIQDTSQGSITASQFTSTTATQNIHYSNSNRQSLANNIINGTTTGILIGGSCTRLQVHDNTIDGSANAISIAGTYCDLHDNIANSGNITETTGANNNKIHDNLLYAGAGQTITIVGAATQVQNNPGYNPQGAAAITVTASPFTYTAGPTPETVYISGGTVSAVAKNSITLFAATNCNVNLQPNEALTVTYSVAPTMNKDRH